MDKFLSYAHGFFFTLCIIDSSLSNALEKLTIKSIDLNPLNIQSEWQGLKDVILSTPLKELFTDHLKLKVFVANFFEYFREYDVLKECSIEEYQAILYYIALNNKEHSQTIKGEELKMVIRILSKLREEV
ncbi:MAG: hypothetical protein RLN79_14490 [Cytophagales bacterium]